MDLFTLFALGFCIGLMVGVELTLWGRKER